MKTILILSVVIILAQYCYYKLIISHFRKKFKELSSDTFKIVDEIKADNQKTLKETVRIYESQASN